MRERRHPGSLTMAARRSHCPFCGSDDTRPIVYGLITGFSDDFVPGGCTVFEGQPARACRACRRSFEYPGNTRPGTPRADAPGWGIDLVRVLTGEDPYRLRDQRWGGLTSIDDALAKPRTDDV